MGDSKVYVTAGGDRYQIYGRQLTNIGDAELLGVEDKNRVQSVANDQNLDMIQAAMKNALQFFNPHRHPKMVPVERGRQYRRVGFRNHGGRADDQGVQQVRQEGVAVLRTGAL